MKNRRFGKIALLRLAGLAAVTANTAADATQEPMAPPTPVVAPTPAKLLWKFDLSEQIGLTAFSPNGKLFAAAARGKVLLWDVTTGQALEPLTTGRESWVTAMEFAPDSKTLATADVRNTISLWDVRKGALDRTLFGHREAISCLRYSADGAALASGSFDKTVRLWSLATGATVKTIAGFAYTPRAVAFADGGKSVTIVGQNRHNPRLFIHSGFEISRYDTLTGRQIQSALLYHLWTSSFHGPLVLSPDGNTIASKGLTAPGEEFENSHGIRLYNIKAGQFSQTVFPVNILKKLAFSSDGKTLAIGKQYNVVFWDGQTKASHESKLTVGEDAEKAAYMELISFAVSTDNELVAVVANDTPFSATSGKPVIRIWQRSFESSSSR